MKKVLSFLLATILIISIFSIAVSAEDILSITEDGTYIIDSSISTPVNISNTTATITLQDANIQANRSAIKVSDNSNVTFILEGTNTISGSPTVKSCGIEVGYGSKITFEGSGTLNVTGGEFGAAIGSYGTGTNIDFEDRAKVGEITINSGTINAFAGRRGSGIGSGYHVSGNKITINGGTIHAYGKECGAGIGSGYGTSGGANIVEQVGGYDAGTIIINGGEVYALANYVESMDYSDLNALNAQDPCSFAAGIGGGYGSSASDIQINGGKVVALGSGGGAGIGGGRGTSSAAKYNQDKYRVNVKIGGNAEVTAITADSRTNEFNSGGAAIGSGRGTHYGGSIEITDNAKVTAISATQAPAIGASKQKSPVDGAIPVADSITIGDNVQLYAVTAGTYAVDKDSNSFSINPSFFGSSDKWFFNEDAIAIADIANVKVASPSGEKDYSVPTGSVSLWANITSTKPDIPVDKGNLRIDTPLKMAVAFEDGSVYYGGEMKEVEYNKEYRFQMCTVNWSNGLFDDNNGLRGSVVYKMELVHNNEFNELAAAAKEEPERYTVKGIDIIDNIDKKIIINGDAADAHLETDVNNFFMAYRFYFTSQDYNHQTGIDNVIYSTGGEGKYDKPLEALSVNLPLGSTITAKAYHDYEYLGQDNVYISIDEDNLDNSYKDYIWSY